MNYQFNGTPGPWHFWHKYEGENNTTIKADNIHICDIIGAHDECGVTTKTIAKANACLIETAPELLECLIESVKHIKETDFDVCGTPESLMEKWQNTIKKALGQIE